MKYLRYLWLLIRAYPIAKTKVFGHYETQYVGAVKMQIAYNETRLEILKREISTEENITGAVVYLAISLAYLLNKK